MLGELIGNYRIVRKLGEGGMGEVYLAEHESIGTHVAVKLLFQQISTETAHVDRFFNEARAVARIPHAGIVKIYDVGHTASGRAYLLMEFLEGESLSARIARGALPLPATCELARQIASVLAATHATGVIHRDLKPDNIFLVADLEQPGGERAKVLDFGIAKLTGALAYGRATQSQSTMGTPAYMSPEQWGDASKVDARADIYSLGCIAFEMATGRPPFEASSIMEACALHTQAPAPRLRTFLPSAPQILDDLLDRMLAKSPAARPQTMAELVRAFADLRGSSGVFAASVGVAPASAPAAATMAAGPAAPPARARDVAATAVGHLRSTPAAIGEVAAPAPAALLAAPAAPARRSRAPLYVGGAILVGGGAVAAAVALGGGGKGSRTAIAAPVAIDAGAPVAAPIDAAPPAPIDAAPVIDAPPAPPLRERVEAADPFVPVGSLSAQRDLVSREAYDWYLATLPADAAAAGKPLRAADAASTAAVWITFAQARAFCAAIDATLPTSAQWYALTRARAGTIVVGPASEWTGPAEDGVALVREPGDRGREPADPLYLTADAPAGATPESIAGANLGFRCVR